MKHFKKIIAAVAVAAGVLLAVLPGRTTEDALADMEPELDQILASRAIHVSPEELLDTIYNANTRLRILDARDEADFNLFHIIDAQRVTLDEVSRRDFAVSLPSETVFVVVSNGEKRAEEVWKQLKVFKVPNVYILAGGINKWVELYAGAEHVSEAAPDCEGQECRRYIFEAALGDKHPASDPGLDHDAEHAYQKKIKHLGHKRRKSGGCG